MGGNGEQLGRHVSVVALAVESATDPDLVVVLDQWPSHLPFALVVVQRSPTLQGDPIHQRLRAASPWPVVVPSQDHSPIELRAGRVYLLSSNITLDPAADGRALTTGIRPSAGEAEDGVLGALLEALAAVADHRVVAVVLGSLTCQDLAGLRALRAAGGWVIVRGPVQNASQGLLTALVQGLVDALVPLGDVASQLLYQSPPVSLATLATGAIVFADSQLEAIQRHLQRTTGRDFAGYKRSTLERRVWRRMQLQRLETVEAYLERLDRDPAEVQALYGDLLIGVTEFFRDPEVFAALERSVLPSLLAAKPPGEGLRLWVAGCASGEEALSLAMVVREALDRFGDRPVKIFATDLDERALTSARRGRYSTAIENPIPPGRLARFFARVDDGYAVDPALREWCLFARHDVARDPPFSQLDLISCRNLFIYISAEEQRRVIQSFHYGLRPGGYLVLGKSENLPPTGPGFEVVDRGHHVYRREVDAPSPQPFPVPHGPPATPRAPQPFPGPHGGGSVGTALDHLVLREYVHPLLACDERGRIYYLRGAVHPYLAPLSGEPALTVDRLIRPELRSVLQGALLESQIQQRPAERRQMTLTLAGGVQCFDLEVRPLPPLAGMPPSFLVAFLERGSVTAGDQGPGEGAPCNDLRTVQLEGELSRTQEQLQATIEQLGDANANLAAHNEELLSVNEELCSANEELEISREELRASNEALEITNHTLYHKLGELDQLNGDLNNLLQSTDLAVMLLDTDGRIRRFTPVVQQLFRLLPGDVGRPLADIVALMPTEGLFAAVAAVMDGEAIQVGGVTTHDGERHFLQRVTPYRSTEGAVVGAVVTFVDTTAQQQARLVIDTLNHRLQGQLEELEALYHNAPMAIYLLDGILKVLRANAAAAALDPKVHRGPDLVGCSILEVLHPALRPRLEGVYRRVLRGETLHNLEISLTEGPVEEHRVWLGNYFPLWDGARQVVGVNALVVDITALRRASLALRDSQSRYRAVAEHSLDGFARLDGEGRIQEVNHRLAQWLGHGPEALVGRPWRQLVAPAWRQSYGEATATLRPGDDSPLWEGELLTPDQRPLPVECWHYAASTAPDAVALWVFVRDTSERRRLEQRQRQHVKLELLGQLAGEIAHNLNNLLQVIAGNCQLLQELNGPELSDDGHQILADMGSAVEDSRTLVEGILGFARGATGYIEVVELNAFLDDLVRSARPLFPKAIDVHYRSEAEDLAIVTQPQQLRATLLNLMVNAKEAMTAGGEIHLTLRQTQRHRPEDDLPPGHYAWLTVVDQGSGMDEMTLQRAVEPFFSTKPKGTGLGLSSAYEFVRLSGGALRLSCPRVGGTQVEVWLPQADPEAVSHLAKGVTAKPGEAVGKVSTGRGETVLVVEDRADVRQYAVRALERLNYRAIPAGSVAEVRAVVARHPALDAVLSDVVLTAEEVDGFAVVAALRHHNPPPAVGLVGGVVAAPRRRPGWF
ncbi:MAG: CheR family methyltransferase [Candidatus Competibacterales bacterium]